MLIPARRLIRRFRQPRSRVAEVAAVRRRFATVRRAGTPTGEERELARRMRGLRIELAAALGRVASCAGCTRGQRWPEGAFDGGHCCSGHTDDVFGDVEVAALALGGTRARDLRPPAPVIPHAGCAFRGVTGCTLAVADRPNLCALYLCTELRRELFRRGDIARIVALADAIEADMRRFVDLRTARLDGIDGGPTRSVV